ncbi:MAG: hypothetical protein JW915_21365 [Chitinispirillaceae bacterium]|nr:hypothetical protein [Chitinispirillaceae bacterium]
MGKPGSYSLFTFRDLFFKSAVIENRKKQLVMKRGIIYKDEDGISDEVQ